MLQVGSSGDKVKDLQTRLILEGYNCGSAGADGEFGEDTRKAVIRFQQEVGLKDDGIVGDETWNAIIAVTGPDGNTSILKSGDKGESVKVLQQKLISRGYSCGSAGADGDFGPGTYNAVVKFQEDHGLEVDGIVGAHTLAALESSVSSTILKQGCTGALVKELQQKLISRGYSCGSAGADGDFGPGTYDAVIRFQQDNGLSADGIVGPITWDALNGFQFNTLLKLGSKGDAVRELQQKLISKGYSCGSAGADGDFGQGTYNAVINFQEANGLEVDGIVGPNTWAVLNSSSYSNYTGELLKSGSKGDAVISLQRMLILLGYSCGSSGADGDFGSDTYNAVVKFQKDHGLEDDGVVGPNTWNALYAAMNGNEPSMPDGVKKFLEVARLELGYHEAPGNINKYGEWYNNNGDYWCAQFVSWCAMKAGILGALVPKYQSCRLGAKWYMARGRYGVRASYTPVPGDIIFFTKGTDNWYHTGIVESVSGGCVNTIEGNTDDAVRRRSYSLTSSIINGYGKNGGIVDDNDTILQRASKTGMFKDLEVCAPGFNKEYPMGVLSLMPLVTYGAVISYTPLIAFSKEKTLQLTSTGAMGLATTMTDGLTSAGLNFDFNKYNIKDTLDSVYFSFEPNSKIKYTIELPENGKTIKMIIQHKVVIDNKEIYQGIYIRVDLSMPGIIYVPLTSKSSQSANVNADYCDAARVAFNVVGIGIILGLIAVSIAQPQTVGVTTLAGSRIVQKVLR